MDNLRVGSQDAVPGAQHPQKQEVFKWKKSMDDFFHGQLEYSPEHVGVDCFECRIREGLAGPQEPALLGHRSAVGGLVVAGRMPERSQHRVSGGLDGRSERPAMGSGQPRTRTNRTFSSGNCFSFLGRSRRTFPRAPGTDTPGRQCPKTLAASAF